MCVYIYIYMSATKERIHWMAPLARTVAAIEKTLAGREKYPCTFKFAF